MNIKKQSVPQPFEYLGKGVSKADIVGSVTNSAKSLIKLEESPSLYITGKRTVTRIENLDAVLEALANADVRWNLFNRIVTEVHNVTDASIFIADGFGAGASLEVRYELEGMPVVMSDSYDHHSTRLMKMPNVTGTIAFGAIQYIPILNYALFASGQKRFEYKELDVSEPLDFEDNIDED